MEKRTWGLKSSFLVKAVLEHMYRAEKVGTSASQWHRYSNLHLVVLTLRDKEFQNVAGRVQSEVLPSHFKRFALSQKKIEGKHKEKPQSQTPLGRLQYYWI